MSNVPAPVSVNLPKAWKADFVKTSASPTPASPIHESPTTKKTFEAVGEWVQKSLWANAQKQQIDSNAASKNASPSGSPTDTGAANMQRVKAGGAKLEPEDFEVDYYEVLALDEDTSKYMNADEMKLHYRKRCIETHPDKMADHSDKLFKQVQRGYEIMCNLASRRAYDSSRPFDDTIPRDGDVAPEKFYSTFAEVFERNTRFSLDLPLPVLGDDETPIKDVKKFYDAWYRFRTWRDFSHSCDDLEKIEDSMDRYQKRMIQKDNLVKLGKKSKEEMTRVRNLVDRCNQNDPRLKREAAAAVEAAEAAKVARDAEKNARADRQAKEKRDKEEAEKKAVADKINKLKGDKEALKDLRLSLMAFFTENELLDSTPSNALYDTEVCQKNINWLSTNSNAEQIAALMAEITNKSVEEKDEKVEAVLFFNECVKQTEQDIGRTRYGEAIKSTKQKQKEEEARLLAIEMAKPMKDRKVATYETEEVEKLNKACGQYPEGTKDRIKKLHAKMPDSKKFSDAQLALKVTEIEASWVADPKLKPEAPDMGHKARLVRQLTKYCPEKVKMADAMLKKYEGKEEEFLGALVKKFGKEPEADW